MAGMIRNFMVGDRVIVYSWGPFPDGTGTVMAANDNGSYAVRMDSDPRWVAKRFEGSLEPITKDIPEEANNGNVHGG